MSTADAILLEDVDVNKEHRVWALTFHHRPIKEAMKILEEHWADGATHATLIISRRVPTGQAKRKTAKEQEEPRAPL